MHFQGRGTKTEAGEGLKVAQDSKKYDHRVREPHWAERWKEHALYRWKPGGAREDSFVVDSPPPTVSGSLHVGHVFSYTHQDLLVRYQRMRGKNICYPMGWDDNGLPTERRVQNLFRVRCNPHLPYDPDFTLERRKKGPIQEVSRGTFIEACARVTQEDEEVFEALWRQLGLSIDWSLQYATIDRHCRSVSQRSFLELVEKGLAYSTEAPTLWEVDFKTAVAQAEVQDRMREGAFHDIRFQVENGEDFIITTTRPELLAACIAVAAHPEDDRYQEFFGKWAVTPVFGSRVPILPAEHADPEKGTGILMVCTFGDSTDVEFWKRSELPVKPLIGREGRLLPIRFGEGVFDSVHPEKAQSAYQHLSGLTVQEARQKMVELLARDIGADGCCALVEEPRPVEHPVKFYERGERPLEFVTTRQWFISLLEHREQLKAQGRKIQWHPTYMETRYQHWVEGLNLDWCISRQRYFGVPFPVWYPLDDACRPDYANPIFASVEALPVDPLSECPPGFTEEQRGRPGGFQGDQDVMDTWATSSLTPQIISHWGVDEQRHQSLFPMDIRPQSHEIIRTWAFYTIVKAWMHHQEIPWKHVVISGWILDPDRKKMSKSVGNVVTPAHLLEQYSADGVRYWAARARLGADTAFDESVLKVGKRLANKLFNASKFVVSQLARVGAKSPPVEGVCCELDRGFVAALYQTVAQATEAFDRFDYAAALEATERQFWTFCNDYLELVKRRSYAEDASPQRDSVMATLGLCLGTFVRLFAPFLPFVTEEIWSWGYSGEGSVHTAAWPCPTESESVPPPAHSDSYALAVEVLGKIRMAKTEGKRNLRWPVKAVRIAAEAQALEALREVTEDLIEAGNVNLEGVTLEEQPGPLVVSVDLAPESD